MDGHERCFPVRSEADLSAPRLHARALGARLGFSACDVTAIVTAVSEVTWNILRYAGEGELHLSVTEEDHRTGILVIARDRGPGIADVDLALQDGYSTGGGLGIGLPGVKRLMDDFGIVSEEGRGTTVRATKWLRGPE